MTSANKIAILTYTTLPDGADDDRLFFEPLKALGVTPVPVVWDRLDVDWHTFDAVIVRSCWDYYKKIDTFQAWLDQMETERLRVLNAVSTIRWNMDKIYLKGLREKGAPVIPAVWVSRGETLSLTTLFETHHWDKVVVKPTISAGAYKTWMASRETAADQQPDLDRDLQSHSVIIQKFIPEVSTQGEWSFHFFNKRFSHAIIKTPKPGDFRIQGGTVQGVAAPPALLAQAEAIIADISDDLLYARVDGLVLDGQLHLMEVELIEPRLYLAYGDGAPERFAQAIRDAL